MIDIELAKWCLSGIKVADHMGDVNRYIPDLCKALELPEPEWDGRWHFAWDEKEED
jgi:hypothetical protein